MRELRLHNTAYGLQVGHVYRAVYRGLPGFLPVGWSQSFSQGPRYSVEVRAFFAKDSPLISSGVVPTWVNEFPSRLLANLPMMDYLEAFSKSEGDLNEKL